MNKGKFCLLFLATLLIPFVGQAVTLYNPLGTTDVPTLIGKVLSVVIGVIGAIALAIFIYGGFLWMTSAGDSKNVEKGKNAMVYAVLGLIVIFSASTVMNFIFKFF